MTKATLKPNYVIRIQVQNTWLSGIVVWRAETPQSYIVRGPSGCEYQRNHKHHWKVAPPPIDIDDTDEVLALPAAPVDTTPCNRYKW